MIDVGGSFAFSPTPVTVHVGDTVTWTNHSAAVPHTTTSDTGLWDSGVSPPLSPGQSFSHLFSAAGTFTYHCNVHPFMHGTVVVQASTPTTTTTRPTTSTTRPSGTGGATTTVAPSVLGTRGTTAASGLATTGAQEAPLVGLALAAVLTGLLVVSFGGRRRRAGVDPDMT